MTTSQLFCTTDSITYRLVLVYHVNSILFTDPLMPLLAEAPCNPCQKHHRITLYYFIVALSTHTYPAQIDVSGLEIDSP